MHTPKPLITRSLSIPTVRDATLGIKRLYFSHHVLFHTAETGFYENPPLITFP